MKNHRQFAILAEQSTTQRQGRAPWRQRRKGGERAENGLIGRREQRLVGRYSSSMLMQSTGHAAAASSTHSSSSA